MRHLLVLIVRNMQITRNYYYRSCLGIKKGAFTGADQDQAGLVDQAQNGILFLDEVHRLPPEGQEMLFFI